MVEVMKIMATSFKRSSCTASLSSPDPAAGHRQPTPLPLLDTHGQVWVSLLWGHCSFLLGPDLHKVFFCALQESVSPVLCKFWQLYDGVNGYLPKRAYAISRSAVPRAPAPVAGRPLVTCTSSGDTHTLKGRSGSFAVGSPDVHKVLFEPSEHLWWEGVSF